jgi:hypothetical protein
MQKISCMKSDGRLALSNEKTSAAHFVNSSRLSMVSQFRLDEGARRLPPFLFENLSPIFLLLANTGCEVLSKARSESRELIRSRANREMPANEAGFRLGIRI